MTKMLITPSLLNSYQYFRDYQPHDDVEDVDAAEAAQRREFLNTLRRIGTPLTDPIMGGIMFENAVRRYCETGNATGTVIREVGELVKGGIWQTKVKKELGDFLLYGVLDVMKADTIFDLKKTANYDVGKYLNSAQHRIYFYCTDMPKFSYIPATEYDWYREDYFNHPNIKKELEAMIAEFTDYLKTDTEANEIFLSKWKALS